MAAIPRRRGEHLTPVRRRLDLDRAAEREIVDDCLRPWTSASPT